MTPPHVSPAEFVSAMRQFPAAVNIVTTGTGESRAGFTATAVMSLTAEPPRIGVAVNRTASAFPHLQKNQAFCVNTLAAHHSELAGRFAGAVKGSERFLTGSWGELSTGAPALTDAKINLDCIVEREVDLGSHVLFVGAVKCVRTQDDLKPLLYVEGNWASLLPGFDAGQSNFMNAVEKSIEAIDAAANSSSDPLERLDQFVRNFTHVYIDQQTVTRDYLTAEIYVSPEVQDNLNAAKQTFDRKLVDLLEEGRRTGRFDLEDSRITALAISGLVAWLHRWFKPEGRLTPDDLARLFSDLVRRMVEPRPDALTESAATRKAQDQHEFQTRQPHRQPRSA